MPCVGRAEGVGVARLGHMAVTLTEELESQEEQFGHDSTRGAFEVSKSRC